MDFESFKFFCIRLVRHSRNMPSNNKQYFFMFLIGESASVRVFRSLNPISSQEKITQ